MREIYIVCEKDYIPSIFYVSEAEIPNSSKDDEFAFDQCVSDKVELLRSMNYGTFSTYLTAEDAEKDYDRRMEFFELLRSLM